LPTFVQNKVLGLIQS